MKKLLMVIPLVFLLCFAAEYSNAKSTKVIVTLQNGDEISTTSIIIAYQRENTSGTDISWKIHYYFEVNKVETHRAIKLSKVESIEFIANEEDKSFIEQVKINLWDGGKVIYKKLIDADDSIEEISPAGEKKTYKSTDFLCNREYKSRTPYYSKFIIFNTKTRGKMRIHKVFYRAIKMIKFEK